MNITKIMDMLDWDKPYEIQVKGRNLAKSVENIGVFLQPVTSEHNKNVWENCAIILSEKTDNELKPHLVKMLEWLQDMNWPGAFCVFQRLQKYSDKKGLLVAINMCIEMSAKNKDINWQHNLNLLGQID